MKKIVFIAVFVISLCLISSDQALAMMHGEGHRGPYGGYCRGPRWGWYGAHRTVNTVEDVRATLREFLKETDHSIGEIVEKPNFYAADILDAEGAVVDTLIVDKRTGRIRSKY